MFSYLNYPGIEGSVTASGYKGWIEIIGMRFGSSRAIDDQEGQSGRAPGYTRFSEIEIIKHSDHSSPYLFQETYSGKGLNDIKIHICHPGTPPVPHMEYTLGKVFVSHYEELFGAGGDKPIEIIHLNFAKIEKKYISYDESNRPEAPAVCGYDCLTRQVV